MNYTLAVLTCPGRTTLGATVESFFASVTPRPAQLVLYCDGDTDAAVVRAVEGREWDVIGSRKQQGFCRATKGLWEHVAEHGEKWVFWLEDDFVFRRGVDLRDLGFVMDRQRQLAQMALYRNPVNDQEVLAGGYMRQYAEEYQERGGGSRRWFEHRRNWTTNPALFRSEICRKFRWPDVQFCEGVFGFHIRGERPDTTFGVWGAGDVWVEHVGARVGFGY